MSTLQHNDDIDGSPGMYKCLSQHSKFWGIELTHFSKIPDTKIFKRVASRGAHKVGHICIDLFNATDRTKCLQMCFASKRLTVENYLRSWLKSEEKKPSRSQFEGNPPFLFSHVICCGLSRKPYGKCLLKPRHQNKETYWIAKLQIYVSFST